MHWESAKNTGESKSGVIFVKYTPKMKIKIKVFFSTFDFLKIFGLPFDTSGKSANLGESGDIFCFLVRGEKFFFVIVMCTQCISVFFELLTNSTIDFDISLATFGSHINFFSSLRKVHISRIVCNIITATVQHQKISISHSKLCDRGCVIKNNGLQIQM